MQTLLIVSSIALWVGLGFNLLLTLMLVRRVNGAQAPEPEQGLRPGELVPNFSAQTLAGAEVTLGDYYGRSAAFLFVGPGCEPCREALPMYEALGPQARRAGVELVLVSVGEPEETRALAEELKLQLPLLVAPSSSNSLMRDYKINGTPGYCLIDSRAMVISSGYPSMEGGDWKELVDQWRAPAARAARLTPSIERG